MAQTQNRVLADPKSLSDVQSALKPAAPAKGGSVSEEVATGEFLKGPAELG